jgi:hypothetical protein
MTTFLASQAPHLQETSMQQQQAQRNLPSTFGSRQFSALNDLVGMSTPVPLNGQTASTFEKIALDNPEKRITIWNRVEKRKISGNAAPMGKNLLAYLTKHPQCEIHEAQDKNQSANSFPSLAGCEMEPSTTFSFLGCGEMPLPVPPTPSNPIPEVEKRVTIWHRKERRKISGNAAPMEKNLTSYLLTHPLCEIYRDQDKVDNVKPASPTSCVTEQSCDSKNPFDEKALAPIEIFDCVFDDRIKFMSVPSPSLPMLTRFDFIMSPVDSLSSSVDFIDFSLGSYFHVPKRMRTTYADVDDDFDQLEESLSSGPDEFGVFGELEGF